MGNLNTMAQRDSTPGPAQRVGVRELRGNLTGYLRQVRQGASLLVTSHDEVIAEIRPPAQAAPPRRKPGALRGRIIIMPDFDATPPDLIAAMEGEGS